MKRIITPEILSGKVKVPPSKSLSHRAIIAASLCEGKSKVDNILFSEDIIATLNIMEQFGAQIVRGKDYVIIDGIKDFKIPEKELQCNESGSTLRFLIPMGLLSGGQCTYVGNGKLVSRPIDTYIKILEEQGIDYKYDGSLPLTLDGTLKAGDFVVPGNISSQFITGLLFVLPLLEENSKIIIEGPLESKGYIDLTIDILKTFGIDILNLNHQEYIIRGGQKYKARDYYVEGDYSQVAFWIVAGIIGDGIEIEGINEFSLQGDRRVLDIVKEMGADLEFKDNNLIVSPSKTKGITIDGSQCPDIIPVLSVLAALSQGETRVVNGARLRIKESDRIKSTIDIINRLGGNAVETEDGLIIEGKDSLKGGSVDSWNDHRIAMSSAVAAIRCEGKVTITGSSAVNKSYPTFYEDYTQLGGKVSGEYI
ncbi:MAG: 3-phosphoshikimate 1-carboxyvinyltransferase [Firmicutes bacterium]|jgi:3-phosphoshikimate 1-carboxyvinyltransferase|nr:3-phosphoshikimate 1-carboxyvinyltransferase [Bacillota bacterium]